MISTASNDWYTALLVSKLLIFFIFSEYIHITIIRDMYILDEGKRSDRGRGMHNLANGGLMAAQNNPAGETAARHSETRRDSGETPARQKAIFYIAGNIDLPTYVR